MTIQKLAHDAHLVPVVGKLSATFQADNIVAGGGADGLPGRADGAGAAGGRSRSKRLRDFPVAAGDGEELEKFFDHNQYSVTKKRSRDAASGVSTPKNNKKSKTLSLDSSATADSRSEEHTSELQ